MSDAPPTGSLLRFATTLVTRQRRAAAVLLLLNLGIIAVTLITPLLTGWAVERIDADDLSGIDGAFVAALAIALAGLLAATLSAAAGVVNSRISAVVLTDLRPRLSRHCRGGDGARLRTRARAARALCACGRTRVGRLAGRQPDGRSLADGRRHAPARRVGAGRDRRRSIGDLRGHFGRRLRGLLHVRRDA